LTVWTSAPLKICALVFLGGRGRETVLGVVFHAVIDPCVQLPHRKQNSNRAVAVLPAQAFALGADRQDLVIGVVVPPT